MHFLKRSLMLTFIACATAVAAYAQSSILQVTQTSPMSTSKPGYNPNVFNPAMGLVLDAVASQTRNNNGNFDFRSAELNLMAAVDPFANLYAVLNGTPDGVEVEEAAFITTSLPYNLTARGGRFFANFGRFAHWHPHELPFVNSPTAIDAYVGGESRAEGVEMIHLFKTPFFLQGTLGAYNKMGAENNRLEETDGTGHTEGRSWDAMTYLGRLFSYAPLGDDFGVDLGVSDAFTPKQNYIDGVRVDDMNTQRHLTGVDITFRYEPLKENAFRKLLWGTEFFRNDERRRDELAMDTDGDGVGDADAFNRYYTLGGYSYVDYHFARRWNGGGFFDYAEDPENLKQRTVNKKTYGAMINFTPSEFQRIRLQYSQAKVNDGSPVDHQVFLQWFGTIGTHVHLFKDR